MFKIHEKCPRLLMFTLPQLAEKLVDLTPGADWAIFAKVTKLSGKLSKMNSAWTIPHNRCQLDYKQHNHLYPLLIHSNRFQRVSPWLFLASSTKLS